MVDVDAAIVAKLKKDGQTFEILVDCDNAISYREGKTSDISDVLAVENIFVDAKKGLVAPQNQIKEIFGTDDVIEVADAIIRQGEIHATADHKNKVREQKKKQIIEMIHRNGIDPKTGIPHPITRIENAFSQAGIQISDTESIELQVREALKKLNVIIPIKLDTRELNMHVPAAYASKSFGIIKGLGSVLKSDWAPDGSLNCVLEIPAGLQEDVLDKMNALTQGNAEIKINNK